MDIPDTQVDSACQDVTEIAIALHSGDTADEDGTRRTLNFGADFEEWAEPKKPLQTKLSELMSDLDNVSSRLQREGLRRASEHGSMISKFYTS